MIYVQAYIQAAVRFVIVVGCMGFVLFTLEMSRPENPQGMCNAYHATDCFDRLAVRR